MQTTSLLFSKFIFSSLSNGREAACFAQTETMNVGYQEGENAGSSANWPKRPVEGMIALLRGSPTLPTPKQRFKGYTPLHQAAWQRRGPRHRRDTALGADRRLSTKEGFRRPGYRA